VTGSDEPDQQQYAEALGRFDSAIDRWQELRRAGSDGDVLEVMGDEQQAALQELQESLAAFRTASRHYWAEKGFDAG
jgi:hypothetical protein